MGYAFSGCSSLTSVKFPNCVTNIRECAFDECSGLTKVEIPNSVTTIEAWAFSGCSGLTDVEIPKNVTEIGRCAFSDCSGLASIKVLNKDCSIYNDSQTIPNNAVIYGYAGSTAQSYAKKYNRKFVSPGT